MNAFRVRQLTLLAIMCIGLLVTLAGSQFLRGVLVPVTWGPPFYVNPLYLFTFAIWGGMGFLLTRGSGDGGWPWIAAMVGLWIFIVAFEDSILQWFVFQLGVATIGGRVNPIQMASAAATVGALILLHVNQLGRRLHEGLADRGLDPRELQEVERRTFEAGTGLVLRLVGLIAAAGFVLLVAEFILGRATVGLGAIGILGGLLIVGFISMLAYGALRKGPVPGVIIESGSEGPVDAGVYEQELRPGKPHTRAAQVSVDPHETETRK